MERFVAGFTLLLLVAVLVAGTWMYLVALDECREFGHSLIYCLRILR